MGRRRGRWVPGGRWGRRGQGTSLTAFPLLRREATLWSFKPLPCSGTGHLAARAPPRRLTGFLRFALEVWGCEVGGAGKQGPRPCRLFRPGVHSLFFGRKALHFRSPMKTGRLNSRRLPRLVVGPSGFSGVRVGACGRVWVPTPLCDGRRRSPVLWGLLDPPARELPSPRGSGRPAWFS